MMQLMKMLRREKLPKVTLSLKGRYGRGWLSIDQPNLSTGKRKGSFNVDCAVLSWTDKSK